MRVHGMRVHSMCVHGVYACMCMEGVSPFTPMELNSEQEN